MYKIMLTLSIIIALFLSGCSNSTVNKSGIASGVYNDSKEVYQILADYMQNGKNLDGSKQRKIDNYISKAKTSLETYSEKERSLVETVLTLNSSRENYDILVSKSDKALQMDAFNKKANILSEFFGGSTK